MAITQGFAGSGGGGGGGAVTLDVGSVSAGAYVLGSILDGAIVTLGALGDTAVGDASGSLNAHTRQIAKLLGAGITLGAGAAVIGAVTQSGTWNVTVNTALPAGANAIGTVGVTSLPALPAGANSIGTVVLGAGAAVVGAVTQSGTWNVTVNAALPAGSNTIGAVTGPGAAALATDRTAAAAPFSQQLSDGTSFYVGAKTGQLPTALISGRLDVSLGAAPAAVTLGAGTAIIGEVGGITNDALTATPTITAGAYVSGDSLGGKLTLATAVRVSAGSGVIQEITVTDKGKKNNAIDFLFFIGGDPVSTTFTDHAQLTVNAADLLNCKVVSFPASQYTTLATNSVGTLPNIGLPFKLTTGQTLFAAAVARGTTAYATTSDLSFRFGVYQD